MKKSVKSSGFFIIIMFIFFTCEKSKQKIELGSITILGEHTPPGCEDCPRFHIIKVVNREYDYLVDKNIYTSFSNDLTKEKISEIEKEIYTPIDSSYLEFKKNTFKGKLLKNTKLNEYEIRIDSIL